MHRCVTLAKEGEPVSRLDRRALIRPAAAGAMVAAMIGLLPGSASAGLPAPTPQGDDVAYLSFATVAERVSRDFYRAASGTAGSGLTVSERRHMYRIASTKRSYIIRLDGALGQQAPLTADFTTVLPPDALISRAKVLGLGEKLETLLVRSYVTGLAGTRDANTRLFLSRVLAYDDQQLAWLRSAGGHTAPGGLLSPIDLQAAGAELDPFLTTPDFPG